PATAPRALIQHEQAAAAPPPMIARAAPPRAPRPVWSWWMAELVRSPAVASLCVAEYVAALTARPPEMRGRRREGSGQEWCTFSSSPRIARMESDLESAIVRASPLRRQRFLGEGCTFRFAVVLIQSSRR